MCSGLRGARETGGGLASKSAFCRNRCVIFQYCVRYFSTRSAPQTALESARVAYERRLDMLQEAHSKALARYQQEEAERVAALESADASKDLAAVRRQLQAQARGTCSLLHIQCDSLSSSRWYFWLP